MLPKSHARILLEKYALDNPTELEIEAIANAEKLIIREDEMTELSAESHFQTEAALLQLRRI